MKILFIDIDGVLSIENEEVLVPGMDIWFDEKCAVALDMICFHLLPKIVISSDWRYHFDLADLARIFSLNGIRGEVIGFTPRLPLSGMNLEEHRSKEIQAWLSSHGFTDDFTQWCSIDDLDLSPFLKNSVKTPYLQGIAAEGLVEKVLTVFD